MTLTRRSLLAASGLMPLLASCGREGMPHWPGGWVGADAARGHRLRDRKSGELPGPASRHRAGVIVVGGGVAGLGAARALMRAGIDDVHVLELESEAGGNSRGHAMGGLGCPLGAHYLPVPGDDAVEVIELLDALGLRRSEFGRPVYDERDLCASPQERIHIDGHWHEGLLPPIEALPEAERASTLAAYRGFAAAVTRLGRDRAFTLPTARARRNPALDALDATTFATWLDAEGLVAPALRWYLDYCCRDDYGAGLEQVSAWAGIHYFASRHGFRAPGEGAEEREGLLTWPEGNARLTRAMAAPLGARLHASRIALRVVEERDQVAVDVLDAERGAMERWVAPQVVLALPLFVAARLLDAPPAALVEASGALRHAPWLVANLQLKRALADPPGAAPAWDNVRYRGQTLGYVDAGHQRLLPYAGPTILTSYMALGGASPSEGVVSRKRLLDEPWTAWADAVVADLTAAHPDLPEAIERIDLMRYGHAMSIPVPGLRRSAALRALAEPQRRVHFAHADLSGYSVFEEALYQGVRAANAVIGRSSASAT